jgi:hypothetical protein
MLFSKATYLRQQVSTQVVHDFLLHHNNKQLSFVPKPMDLLLTGEDQLAVTGRSANSLAEGPFM